MFGGAGTVVLSPSKQFHVKSKRCKKGSRRNKKTGLCVKHSGSLGQSQPKRKSPKRKSPKRKSPKRKSDCAGYKRDECAKRAGCSYSSGPKRSFCRKSNSKQNKKSLSGSIDFGSSHHSSLNSILSSPSIRRHTRHRRHRKSSGSNSFKSAKSSTKSFKSSKSSPVNKWDAEL